MKIYHPYNPYNTSEYLSPIQSLQYICAPQVLPILNKLLVYIDIIAPYVVKAWDMAQTVYRLGFFVSLNPNP